MLLFILHVGGKMAGLVEYDAARAMLNKYKIRSIQSSYVKNADDAIKFANGRAIVLKAITAKAIHKTKSGLIELDLTRPEEIKNALAELEKRAQKFKPFRIQAQQMIPKGMEIIIGGKVDKQFGKMILLGLGGIYVETFKDFALRVCPITKYDAQSMISQLKSAGVIAPDERARELIEDLLLRAAKMIAENDFEELDLNPIILHDGTYDAVDLRILK